MVAPARRGAERAGHDGNLRNGRVPLARVGDLQPAGQNACAVELRFHADHDRAHVVYKLEGGHNPAAALFHIEPIAAPVRVQPLTVDHKVECKRAVHVVVQADLRYLRNGGAVRRKAGAVPVERVQAAAAQGLDITDHTAPVYEGDAALFFAHIRVGKKARRFKHYMSSF